MIELWVSDRLDEAGLAEWLLLWTMEKDILLRFNQEYLPLLGVALLVAVPLTLWGVARWLSGFAHRIDINPLVFLLAGLITLVVTVLAVSLLT